MYCELYPQIYQGNGVTCENQRVAEIFPFCLVIILKNNIKRSQKNSTYCEG